MKMALSRCIAALGLLACSALSFNAYAASTWTFGGTDGGAATTNYGSGTGSLNIAGGYATNTGTSGLSGNWTSGDTKSSLQYYSGGGLGMGSDGTAAPNHAIDNNGTYTESVLMTFGQSTVLNSIGLGYVSGDADISLFRYTGTSKTIPTVAPTFNGTAASLAAMYAAGWQLVGNYGDLSTDTSNPYNLVNGSNLGSSWWLVSAYNTAYGTTSANGGGLNQGDDYFKLYAVAGTQCTSTTPGVCGGRVPEPNSLALASLALFGLVYTRRQFKRKS